MCRVTSTRSTVRGPSASGVTLRLPSPVTSMVRAPFGSMALIVSPSASLSALRVPSSTLMRCEQPSVTYRPIGLPSARACSSLSMTTVVRSTPPVRLSPGGAPAPSIARSVHIVLMPQTPPCQNGSIVFCTVLW